MTEDKTILRHVHNPDNPYLMFERAVAQDKSLSYEAEGMLVYLISKPEDWQIRIGDLLRSGCGRDKAYKILNELKGARHIRRDRLQKEDGTFFWGDYLVYEHPFPENPEMDTGEPFPEIPDTDLPDTVKPTLQYIESTEERKDIKDLPPLAAAALPLVGIRSFQAPDTKVSEGDEPALKKGRKKSQPELAMIVMSIYDKTRMSAENLAAFQAECDLYSTDPIYKGWFDMICRPTLTFTDANGKLVRKKIPEVIELIQMHIGLDKYRQNHSGIAESSATQEVIEDQDWMSKVYEPKSPSAL